MNVKPPGAWKARENAKKGGKRARPRAPETGLPQPCPGGPGASRAGCLQGLPAPADALLGAGLLGLGFLRRRKGR